MRTALFAVVGSLVVFIACAEPIARPLEFQFRHRVEASPGEYRVETKIGNWDPRKTAVVICDMWDDHWCKSSAARVAEMAPRMNDVVAALRERGVLIIHCPSDTMNYYKEHAGRKLAQAAPKIETTIPLQRWCKLDPAREGELPVDDSDNGCPQGPPPKDARVWTHQGRVPGQHTRTVRRGHLLPQLLPEGPRGVAGIGLDRVGRSIRRMESESSVGRGAIRSQRSH